MRSIKVLDALVLNEDGLLAKLGRSKVQQVHLRQGDLDGACAVYATFTTLIILGVVEFQEISAFTGNSDKRTSIGRLKKELLESKGMHQAGNYLNHLSEESIFNILRSNFSRYVGLEYYDKDLLEHIKTNVGQNCPVLISLSFLGGGDHALVVVGFELDSKDDMTKIFCLDPTFAAPKYTYWNAVIDLEPMKGKRYKYRSISETGQDEVKLNDILIISKRTKKRL